MRSFIFFAILGISLIYIADRETAHQSKIKTSYLAPPRQIKQFSFGYDESIADSIWLRVVQDIDFCDQKAIGGGTSSASDEAVPAVSESNVIQKGGYQANDVNRCRDQSWVFSMLDAVTTLAPNFRIPYSVGATLLSVVVRDYGGSSIIFDRGVARFPNDWQLEYKSAFHYLYDIDDKKKAAELLVQAANNGGPQWLFSLAAKLYTAEGQAFLAKSVIQQLLERDPDARFAERLKERLKQADDVLARQQKTGQAAPSALMPLSAPLARPLQNPVPNAVDASPSTH